MANIKSIFDTIKEVLGGVAGILGSLVGVAVLSQIVFGTTWLGMDVVANITGFVSAFLTGGVTGLLVLIILLSLWDSK